MRNFIKIGLVLFAITLLIQCAKDKVAPMAVVEVSINNVGFTSWKVVAVANAADFATLELNNAAYTFERGRRYRIMNMANVGIHPFEFRNSSSQVLLSQSTSNPGSLINDGSINAKVEGAMIEFTVSERFANEVATYNCANHNTMRGQVVFR